MRSKNIATAMLMTLFIVTQFSLCQELEPIYPGEAEAEDVLAFWIEKLQNDESTKITKLTALTRLKDLDDTKAISFIDEFIGGYSTPKDDMDVEIRSQALTTLQSLRETEMFNQYVPNKNDISAAIGGCKQLIEANPVMANKAIEWLMQLKEPQILEPLCMVANEPKVRRYLDGKGPELVPYLLSECQSTRTASVGACLKLLAETKDAKHIRVITMFFYCDENSADNNQTRVTLMLDVVRALSMYGEDALDELELIMLTGRNEVAIRNAAKCCSIIGGDRATKILCDAKQKYVQRQKKDANILITFDESIYLSKKGEEK